VLLHGFLDTWRTWELVLPHLEPRHDVLAPTLPGHAGGPPLHGPPEPATLADAVERAMDAAGFATAHLAGNSLGGHVALRLAARGRARSVVAFAPAGAWAPGDAAVAETLRRQAELLRAARAVAPHAHAIAATSEGRRRATELLVEDAGAIPSRLVEHLIMGVAAAPAAEAMLAAAAQADWTIDLERIACPVRVVWGTRDRLLPWPGAAVSLVEDRLPGVDRVELDGAGHCPQLELPIPAAQLILGLSDR